MGAMSQIASLLLGTVFSIGIGLLWIRFLLQLVHADFYNPIAQVVVKITSPVLNPLRQILPKSKNGRGSLPPLLLVFGALFQLMFLATEFYFWLLIISIVLSWISPGYSPFGALINQLAEPVLAPFRRLLPPLGGLDLSPIVAFLTIQVVQILLRATSGQMLNLMH